MQQLRSSKTFSLRERRQTIDRLKAHVLLVESLGVARTHPFLNVCGTVYNSGFFTQFKKTEPPKKMSSKKTEYLQKEKKLRLPQAIEESVGKNSVFSPFLP